jgi:hypothetical protein
MAKSGGYLLNYINAIGTSWTNNPFGTSPRSGFSWHRTGAGPTGNIYDACLQVDGDSNPTTTPCTGLQPVNMIFDNPTPAIHYDDYRGKLVDPIDELGVQATYEDPPDVK